MLRVRKLLGVIFKNKTMEKSKYETPKENDILVDGRDLICYTFKEGKWERHGTNLHINPKEETTERLRFFSL
tara:strand:+ start:189107 stop:189322 length:216 start_codon:yes stop_codon:yes gene_type:complete